MADENCCIISKEVIKSAENTGKLATDASKNVKDIADKLKTFAAKVEEFSDICENRKNKSLISSLKSKAYESADKIPENKLKEVSTEAIENNVPEEPKNNLISSLKAILTENTEQIPETRVEELSDDSVRTNVSETSKTEVDQVNTVQNITETKGSSVLVEKSQISDLVSTLEETQNAVTSMKDCCIELSDRTNAILIKAHNQAKEIDGSSSTLWPHWPFTRKKHIAAIAIPDSEVSKSDNLLGWFSKNHGSEVKHTKQLAELHKSNIQGKAHMFWLILNRLVCSEEMTYFAAGVSFGMITGYFVCHTVFMYDEKGKDDVKLEKKIS